MKFLDSNGLTYFWNKIKTFIGNNYLSLIGGTIRGNVTFLHQGDGGTAIVVSPSSITKSGYDNHYLFASGKMIPIGEANGVAGLDANGNVPLSQLGNLDTTVAEVVTALPTTNIKKHIYLIEDEDGDTQNQYKEYIYTGDTSATYDASKWEKLGDFRATVDLADYAKKSEAVGLNGIQLEKIPQGGITMQKITFSNINKGDATSVAFEDATTNMSGFMSAADKSKLNKLDMLNIRDDIDVSLLVTAEFNDVTTNGKGNYLSVSLATVGGDDRLDIQLPLATDNANGIMSASNKVKLDGIASEATADSAITTAEIDALFT